MYAQRTNSNLRTTPRLSTSFRRCCTYTEAVWHARSYLLHKKSSSSPQWTGIQWCLYCGFHLCFTHGTNTHIEHLHVVLHIHVAISEVLDWSNIPMNEFKSPKINKNVYPLLEAKLCVSFCYSIESFASKIS